ncbi:trypsin-like peptidase domain-containing protein [Streptomyces sp. NBC_01171]|uniref:S1C family serine protease n=1 Tax=Streptomyces sp. NBC_01171 TaxID=2903757 RepID=UPI0038681A85|nr:trypsin-like peptidase domain-containing protein [Streptomyces sp. NBC_01171]
MNEGHPNPAGPNDDFELAKPAAAAGLDGSGPDRAAEAGDRGPVGGDRPAARDAAPSVTTPGRGDGDADRPAAPISGGSAPEPPHGDGSDGVPSIPSTAGHAPGDDSPAEPPHSNTPGPRDETSGGLSRETADARPADPRTGDAVTARPKPLHDPDPYSTPPYGGPGPWAPAPPVQHPMATPAHGTAVTAPPSPHGAVSPVEPSVSAHQDPAPYQGAPVPPHGEPGPWASAPSVQHPTATPADSAPQADAPASAPTVPAPTQSPEAAPGRNPAPRYDPWNPALPSHQAAPLQHSGAPLADMQRKWPGWKKVIGVFLGVTLLAGGVGGFVGAWVEREGTTTVTLPEAGAVPGGRERDSVAGIAARALPGVVTLHVRGGDEAGTGTGFVLDGRGHILTNNHVVAPASDGGDITVTFSSGETAEAEVVGRDSGYDLAVVQVKGVRGLTPLTLGDSDGVRVGDPVVAIGAPFDLANTVTSGIVSAKDRPITAGGEKGDGTDVSYVDALQTDAPINPGNSGGPLLDAHARVIGVNSAIRSADRDSDSTESRSGSIGLGFAIPANQARRVAEELINTGHATHPVIGVTLDMDYAGDGARIDTEGGAGGPAVLKGGPGDRAGLKPGDLITGVDGHPVHSGEELIVKIRAHRPGDRLRLTVGRPGAGRTVTLRLGASGRN